MGFPVESRRIPTEDRKSNLITDTAIDLRNLDCKTENTGRSARGELERKHSKAAEQPTEALMYVISVPMLKQELSCHTYERPVYVL